MTTGLLGRLQFENPILGKDLRTRMRGAKAFIVQGGYVGMLAVMMGLFYLTWRLGHRAGASPMTVSSDLGRGLYMLLFQTQAALVALITPALTAGTMTLEHEQRTYELLACTRLAPRTIVTGKLLSGWLFVVMLLTCSLPMAALCLMFGGVSGGEIFWSFVMLCLFGLLFGSIGVFWSSLFTRTIAAVLLSYGTIMFYLIATGIFAAEPIALGTLSPFRLIYGSTESLDLVVATVPAWLPGLVLLPLASLFFVIWAISKAPHFAVERAPHLRGLLAVLLTAVTLLGMFSSGPLVGGPGASFLLVPVIGGGAALLLASAFFATGDGPSSRPRSLVLWMLTGLDPRRIFSSQLRGGWAWLLLLAAVFCGALLLGVSLLKGTAAGASVNLTGAGVARIFAVLGAALLSYSALGALGAALNSRRVGIALVVIMFVVTHLVPGIIWIDAAAWGPGESGPAVYGLYFAPYAALSLIGYPDTAKALPDLVKPPAAPPLWAATAVLYLMLAAAGFAFVEIVYQMQRRRAALQPGG
jgi:hypothetical protein